MSTKHTPGPMRVVSAVEVSANAARRWREQYRDWNDDDKFADGTTKGQVNDAINRIAHTPAALAKIFHKSWTNPQCDSCNRYIDFVVQMIEPWADDGIPKFSLCSDCIAHADAIAKAAKGKA